MTGLIVGILVALILVFFSLLGLWRRLKKTRVAEQETPKPTERAERSDSPATARTQPILVLIVLGALLVALYLLAPTIKTIVGGRRPATAQQKAPTPPIEIPDGYVAIWGPKKIYGWTNTELTVEEVSRRECIIFPGSGVQARIGTQNEPATAIPEGRLGAHNLPYSRLLPEKTELNKFLKIYIQPTDEAKEVAIITKL